MITPLPQKAVRAVKRVRVEREQKRRALLTGTRQQCVNVSLFRCFWVPFSYFSLNVFISPRDADSDSVNTMVVHEEEEGEGGDEERAGGYGDQTMLVQRVGCMFTFFF